MTHRTAVVAGASRGVGRGIAEGLGEAGFRVVCLARSTRYGYRTESRAETVEDAAEAVSALGGDGIPYVCDATDPAKLYDAAAYTRRRFGVPDLVVTAVWGGNEGFDGAAYADGTPWGAPFWTRSLDGLHTALRTGIVAQTAVLRAFAPLMMAARKGLMLGITFDAEGAPLGDYVYDVAKAAMTHGLKAAAHDLAPHNVAVAALTPGHVRTERVLDAGHGADATESPRLVGRVVAALAAEPDPMRLAGQSLFTADLARHYDVTDLDGRRPSRFAVGNAPADGA